MHRAPNPDTTCWRIAGEQWGLVNRIQARAAGLEDHEITYRLQTGEFGVVLPHVYALPGSTPSWHREVFAAHLWSGDSSCASHASAGRVWELPDFRSSQVEISTTNRKACGRIYFGDGGRLLVHRVDDHLLPEIVKVGGVPCTSARRTILDLAGIKHRRAGGALDEFMKRGLTDLGQMWLYLEQEGMRGRRGVAILRRMLQERDPQAGPTHSALVTMMERLLREARYPKPVREFPVDLDGLTVHVDLAYPQAKLGIELDSYAWHGNKRAFERDRERDILLGLRGWTVLRFTWAMLRFRRHYVLSVLEHYKPSVREGRTIRASRTLGGEGAG